LSSGDTIYLYGKFNINVDYVAHANDQITIIVDGSTAEIKVFKDKLLSLGSGSSIVLLNGGLLSYTGNCSDNTSIVVGGTEVANCSGTNGAMSFSQVNSAGGFNIGELPVTWLNTKSEVKSRTEVFVSWSTATEINNSHFDVQYSIDGETWNTAGTIYSAANSGFSNEILDYTYTHFIYEVANMVYYRIKQTDHDGKYDYSRIMTAEFSNNVPVQVATLGSNTIKVNIGGERFHNGKINVYDLTGTVIRSVDLSDNNIIQLDKDGVYIIEVVNGYDVQRIKHYVS
jgi:hypothetical protein